MSRPTDEMKNSDDPGGCEAELRQRVADLEEENRRLRSLLGLDDRSADAVSKWEPTLFADESFVQPRPSVGQGSTPEEKIAVFRSLFRGRDDVYALRWESSRTGKAGWSPAARNGFSSNVGRPREFLPLSDSVIGSHLAGRHHAGLYPLLRDDTCYLLACDFDGDGWLLDALAYLDVARSVGIPGALERSRSGNGGHVWVFFEERIPASAARRIGVFLVREAMTVRGEMDLASYDRLFPSQDFLPRQGFGNLIALPLEGRGRREGKTVFLDPATLEPHPDQWEFLSSCEKTSRRAALSLAEAFGDVAAGPDAATFRPGRLGPERVPASVRAVASAMLAVDRIGIPPSIVAGLKHAASLPNPVFFEKESNRFWTGDTPRYVRCYRETIDQILLPRGLRPKAESILAEAGSQLEVTPDFLEPERVALELKAVLRAEQAVAVEAVSAHDLGVLVAPPGAGKTVMACAVMARHQVPTLIIVDRQHLVDQWRDRLGVHLGLSKKEVGQVAGQRKSTGIVDIAMVQSLARQDSLANLTHRYGLVVVDECHHVPAVTFERAVRQIPVQRWLGLTATPYRRDGLQAMMAMHCGPIRHRMTGSSESQLIHREVVVHTTNFAADPAAHIQETFRRLVEDEARTQTICADIGTTASAGRNSLVLTRWTEHLDAIVTRLSDAGVTALVLKGGMGKKATRAVVERLMEPELSGVVLAATASLLGEGFDCPSLDTVFLAFPIRFKGSVEQYVGRILRPAPGKTNVIVHDYVDIEVPVLARMYTERTRGYQTLGFKPPRLGSLLRASS